MMVPASHMNDRLRRLSRRTTRVCCPTNSQSALVDNSTWVLFAILVPDANPHGSIQDCARGRDSFGSAIHQVRFWLALGAHHFLEGGKDIPVLHVLMLKLAASTLGVILFQRFFVLGDYFARIVAAPADYSRVTDIHHYIQVHRDPIDEPPEAAGVVHSV